MVDERPLGHYASTAIENILKETNTSLDGLTISEAERRVKQLGKNTLGDKKRFIAIKKFLEQFKNPLTVILLIASVVSYVLGEHIDATIIGIMVLLSVFLDFVLEYGAEKSAEKLKESVKTKAISIRSGIKKEVLVEDLCVGDLVFLSAGSLVPADARIISSNDFFVNQSSLTGESFPVQKTQDTLLPKESSLTDMTNMIFMGTNVVTGTATAVIVKTGKDTEFGKVAKTLSAAEPESEFDRGVRNFGQLIMTLTFFLVLFIFFFNIIFKSDILDSFMFAIAVAVGLTPELLPMIMSVTMAQGSIKMAKKGVIVKKLSSIPNFGSMDVLCTDKTGTLTEDKIRLVKYTDCKGKDSTKVLEYAYLTSSFQTGIVNPLDEAIIDFKEVDIEGFKKIDEIPFDFVRKKMSVVVERSRKRFIVAKGAPEEIFKCSAYYILNGKKKAINKKFVEEIRKRYHDYSQEGYRVLAVAVKDVPNSKVSFSKSDEEDLTMMGFIAFLDPAKEDAGQTLEELHKAGIEVKIITGDNELVTKKICDEIGIKIKGIMLGNDIDEMTDDALRVRVENTTVFARFSPDEKNRVIMALRANGHVVGYMGDGINDAPSLKTADIGISVSSAVDVAKESADIILTRKSLRELREGVLEGRRTFGNTIKYIMMGISSNFGNMFSVAAAVIFIPFLPMLPIQILLNNFIYDFSQITIPSDNLDKEFIEKPKRWDMKFIKRFMFTFGPISSLFDILTFLMLFFVFQYATPELASYFQTGWFLESLATQTLVVHIIRTKKIPFLQSIASPSLLISSLLCVALGWILPYTPIGKFFSLMPLPLPVLLSIFGLVFVYLIIVQIVKMIFYKKYDF